MGLGLGVWTRKMSTPPTPQLPIRSLIWEIKKDVQSVRLEKCSRSPWLSGAQYSENKFNLISLKLSNFFPNCVFSKGISKEIRLFFCLPLIEVMKFWLWLRLIESKILSWWASYSSRLGNIFSTNWSKLGSGLNDLLETNFFRQVGHSLFPDLKAVTMHSAQNLWNKVVKLNTNL